MSPDQSVIVPIALGIGLLVSLATLVRDLLHRVSGPGWMSRRCGVDGLTTATDTVAGTAPGSDEELLRPRRWYAAWGVVLSGFAVYLMLGSTGNFIGLTGWAENVAWLWLVFLLVAGAFAWVGTTCLRIAARWPVVPDAARPWLSRTVLGPVPDRPSVAAVLVVNPRAPRRRPREVPVRPLGRHHITDARAVALRVTASAWTVVALAVLGLLTARGLIPTEPEELERGVALPSWIVLYVVLLGAALAVYRWELAGSVVMVLAATLLGLLSAIQFPSWVALLVVAVFSVPAFLHWLAWQRDHHVHRLLLVAVVTGSLVVATWAGAAQVYAYFFGPTHPDSVVAPLPESTLLWAWAGATTTTSTVVVARVGEEAAEDGDVEASLVLATSPDGEGEVRSPAVPVDADGVARLEVDGLRAGTTYYWHVEVDGVPDDLRTGVVRTMPDGPSDLRFVAAACARSGSNGAVFDAIRELRPDVYLQLGDIHYANIGVDDPGKFQAALDQVLTMPGQAALLRTTSIAYTWDDHDYSANDGDSTSASRPAAGSVYRAWTPHHPVLSDDVTGPIAQSFVAGRVRVVLTDSRSQRSAPGPGVGTDQQVLGPGQEAWFAEELALARAEGQLVLWVNSTPWIGVEDVGDDSWAGYPVARGRVADLIADADMQDRLVMVAGDAHMVAIDDGSHSDYSSTGAGGFPVLHAAALDRPGSQKGGPYSEGAFPGGGQFGVIEVADDGGRTLTVTLSGRTWDGRTLVEYEHEFPVG